MKNIFSCFQAPHPKKTSNPSHPRQNKKNNMGSMGLEYIIPAFGWILYGFHAQVNVKNRPVLLIRRFGNPTAPHQRNASPVSKPRWLGVMSLGVTFEGPNQNGGEFWV